MKKEIKVVLPFYKLAYSFCFIVILGLIRGVTETYEVGIAMEAPVAFLVSVFCADTYVQEVVSKRSEVQRLYSMKKRKSFVFKRLLIQVVFLVLFEILGYVLFFVFQKPRTNSMVGNETEQFLLYVFAIIVTTCFWGVLSNTLSILFRNVWAGIGGCLTIWLFTNSSGGDKVLGNWNLFSYSFRNIENSADFSWMYGKALCMILVVVMLMILPKLLRRRG